MKTPKRALCIGIAMIAFSFKIASGQNTSTNQVPTNSDYSATLVSPSDLMPVPTVASAPNLVLLQQQPVTQPDTGNVTLQQTSTAVSPVSATNVDSSQSQN